MYELEIILSLMVKIAAVLMIHPSVHLIKLLRNDLSKYPPRDNNSLNFCSFFADLLVRNCSSKLSLC